MNAGPPGTVPFSQSAGALLAAGLSDSTVTALGGLAVALVGLATVLANQRATRAVRIERRRDRDRLRSAETLAEAQRDRDTWRDRYYDERDKRTRLEARLERVLEQYALPTNAGRSGGYPPLPPTPPEVDP